MVVSFSLLYLEQSRVVYLTTLSKFHSAKQLAEHMSDVATKMAVKNLMVVSSKRATGVY